MRRRAEAEADLIGLKLMTLAGYNPRAAPNTFRLLAGAEAKAARAAALSCGLIPLDLLVGTAAYTAYTLCQYMHMYC